MEVRVKKLVTSLMVGTALIAISVPVFAEAKIGFRTRIA